MDVTKLIEKLKEELDDVFDGYDKQYKTDPTMLNRLKVIRGHVLKSAELTVRKVDCETEQGGE